jgi:serine/threonine-protein kinase
MAGPQSARPRSATASSRISIVTEVEEGRFVPGTLIGGRYRIIGLLGRGGMGEVYRATDLMLAQSVALKFLPEDAAANERLLERFHSEVRIARQVSHPNVCRVYDIGEADGHPFISMEYIDGEDLASLLQRIGRLPSDKALEIARKPCAGLAAAHERGVIHRDLKPHNIMLNKRGEVVIMDFGLAAVSDELEGPEARNGTPQYMAPEQLRGDSVTAKSDLYALGLIIYELFTGKRAYEGETLAELMRAQETVRPLSINSIVSDVDPVVEKVILRCLDPDPAQRPPTALAIAAALPGGDPLAAALAAGETPSPELVAASGETEGFRLRYAVPCLVFVLAVALAFPFYVQQNSLLSMSGSDLAPEVLAQRARDAAAEFDYPARPADSKYWFGVADEMDQYFKDKGLKDWRRIFAAESPLVFTYRQSPRFLSASPDGYIRTKNPPADLPGMVSATLDGRGRLREFEPVPPRFDQGSGPLVQLDPAVLFRRVGLDLAQFHEVTPEYAPAIAFDARRAWTGPYPGLDGVNVTVELATWRGKPTSVFMRWPWTKPPATSEPPVRARDLAFQVFEYVLIAAFLFFAALMARRNIRAGRGDRRGAWRIVVVSFCLYAIAVFSGIHFIPSLDMLGYLFENLSTALAMSAILWMAYIALEPAVRARWPHSLITWNRLLNGQWGDPRLGSHVLVGATLGMAILVIVSWSFYLNGRRGGAPEASDFTVLLGARALIGTHANTAAQAIQGGLAAFFLLSGIRAIGRRDWGAALAAALILMLAEGNVRNSPNLAIDIPLFLLLYFALTYSLLRTGLVTMVVALYCVNTASRVVVGPEFTSWYNYVAVVQVAAIAAVAIYGFWRSQSGTVSP